MPPHDKFGKLIEVGDEVIMRFKVTNVQPVEEYCNATLRGLETMPPYEDSPAILSVNTKQVEKVEPVV